MKALDNIKALLATATDANLTLAFHLAIGQGIDLGDCSPICATCDMPIGYNYLVSGLGKYRFFFVCESCGYNAAFPRPH